jgi:hypothetical protein
MNYRLLLALGLVGASSFTLTACPTAGDDDDSSIGDDDDSTVGDELDCSSATVIACGGSDSGTTVGGTNQVDTWSCTDFDTTGSEAFYTFTAAASESVTVRLSPTAEDLDLIVLGAECDEGNCVGSSQEQGDEELTFEATAGTTYTFVVDGFDGAEDSFDIDVTCGATAKYRYVAVRSRTSAAVDIDNNTPGPDIDAISISGAGTEFWATDYAAEDGEWGVADNANADPSAALGEDDAFNTDGTCDLSDDASGNAKFYSLGGGDSALGAEGWVIFDFGDIEIVDGDSITVFELSPADCSNIATVRDDEYEVYIGLDTIDPATEPLSALDGGDWMSLGTTGTGGGITSFDVTID